jgi:hypothetical protein
MRRGTKLGLAGCFLVAAVGGPVAVRFGSSIPPSPVAECKPGYSHGPYMELFLASGHHAVFTRDDVPNPAECLRVGVVVEKRAMELGFRIDGKCERPASVSWTMTPVLLGVGVCLIVIGLLRRRSCR